MCQLKTKKKKGKEKCQENQHQWLFWFLKCWLEHFVLYWLPLQFHSQVAGDRTIYSCHKTRTQLWGQSFKKYSFFSNADSENGQHLLVIESLYRMVGSKPEAALTHSAFLGSSGITVQREGTVGIATQNWPIWGLSSQSSNHEPHQEYSKYMVKPGSCRKEVWLG